MSDATSTEFPSSAKVVVIGAGIVGNCLVGHLARLGWTDMVLLDKGPLPEPRRVDRPRSQLHLPGRPQQGDGAARRAVGQPVPRPRPQRRLGRHRGRPHPGADGRAPAADDQRDGVGRRGRAAHARRGEGARAVHQRPTSSSAASTARPCRSSTRSTPARCSATRRSRRRACRCSPTPRCSTSRPRTSRRPASEGDGGRHRQGPDRGRVRRDRVRRVVEPDRQHGRRHDPARARRAPDGRRRPDGHPRRDQQRDRLPDRPRHGHVLLRAPVVRVDGGRLVRPPADPPPPRRRSRRTTRPRSARPRCRSRRTTSTSRWKRRSS